MYIKKLIQSFPIIGQILIKRINIIHSNPEYSAHVWDPFLNIRHEQVMAKPQHIQPNRRFISDMSDMSDICDISNICGISGIFLW